MHVYRYLGKKWRLAAAGRLAPAAWGALTLGLVALSGTYLAGCSSCQKGSTRAFAPVAAVLKSTAAPASPSPAATPSTTPVEQAQQSHVGDVVPPVTTTSVATIDTTDGAALKHLIFNTSDTLDEGLRHVSEFLVVVYAKKRSCVRLKVRPTQGLNNVVDDSAASSSVQGTDPCAGTTTSGESPPPTPSATPTPTATASTTPSPAAGTAPTTTPGAASPTSAGGNSATTGLTLTGGMGLTELHGITPAAQPPSLALSAETAALCSARLFRMETDANTSNQGLAPVVSKTGRLMVVGSKVRIWLDEEYGPLCPTDLAGRSITNFGPLIQKQAPDSQPRDANAARPGPMNHATSDKLWIDQLQTLATEMDKIYKDMTGTYGPVSDVDGNGFVEIFLSPDVNRHYFIPFHTNKIDHFRANPIFRPQDLAFYDSATNPLSNEGEILYLWTPDPGGLYNQLQYPSANSISSNYAKGFLAEQLMTLIVANQRLLVQKQTSIPDPWLLQSLGLLASAYYAGNDYTALYLGQYLTSQPQYIALDHDPDADLISPAYRTMANDETLGMRTMFGWYLHSRACSGTQVTPCAKLKDLVTATKQGKAALADYFGETFDLVALNFGLSVGLSMLDKPDLALAAFKQTPLPPNYPEAPVALPLSLLEVYPQAQPMTEEEADLAPASLLGGDKTDRTVAGPFPSRKALLFQPITTDSDMEFKVAENAVSYILFTSLVEAQTDVTAFLGAGLNVVFLPAGERDTSLRQIHVDKLSQYAYNDHRPYNLTHNMQDPEKTYFSDVIYKNDDYSVTPSRELWVLGSIDNYQLNIGGTTTYVGGTSAYEIEVKPCDGLAGSDLTACQAAGTRHQVLVQVEVRDFSKQLAPMLLVTDNDRVMYRGHSIHGRMTDIYRGWINEPGSMGVLCAASAGNAIDPSLGTAVTVDPANNGNLIVAPAHGFTEGENIFFRSNDTNTAHYPSFPIGLMPFEQYKVTSPTVNSFQLLDHYGNPVVLSKPTNVSPIDTAFLAFPYTMNACADGGFPGATVFDHSLTRKNPEAFAHNYNNYLQLGPLGFPYTTFNTFDWYQSSICKGDLCYRQAESDAQNYVFALNGTLTPINYVTYPAGFYNIVQNTAYSFFSDAQIAALVDVKSQVDSCVSPDRELDQIFMSECTGLAGLTDTECRYACVSVTGQSNLQAIENQVRGYIQSANAVVSCFGCSDGHSFAPLLSDGNYTHPWVNADHVILIPTISPVASELSYYAPIEPTTQFDYCSGWPGNGATQVTPCEVRSPGPLPVSDIRQQFDLPTNMLQIGDCSGMFYSTEFKFCVDAVSVERELSPEKPYLFWFAGQAAPNITERARVRVPMPIAWRAGEVLEKPERLQAALFDVPGNQNTVINVIVGGRNKSQGEYLLRTRMTNFQR